MKYYITINKEDKTGACHDMNEPKQHQANFRREETIIMDFESICGKCPLALETEANPQRQKSDKQTPGAKSSRKHGVTVIGHKASYGDDEMSCTRCW